MKKVFERLNEYKRYLKVNRNLLRRNVLTGKTIISSLK